MAVEVRPKMVKVAKNCFFNNTFLNHFKNVDHFFVSQNKIFRQKKNVKRREGVDNIIMGIFFC